jgi:hypothetical protein
MKLSDFWMRGCLEALEKFAAIPPERMQALEKQYGHLPANDFNNILKQELTRTATHSDPRLAQGVEQGAGLAAAKPKAPGQNFAFSAPQAASWGPDTFWKKMQFAPPAAPIQQGGAPPKGPTTGVARLGARR